MGAKLDQPVHLYVKTHRKTGLKYFGRTVKDPVAYTGSGVYWTKHVQQYGNDVATQVIGTFYDEERLRDAALAFSRQNRVATSPQWANLLPEDGSPSGDGWAQHDDHTQQIQAIDRYVESRMGAQDDNGLFVSDSDSNTLRGPMPRSGTDSRSAGANRSRQSGNGWVWIAIASLVFLGLFVRAGGFDSDSTGGSSSNRAGSTESDGGAGNSGGARSGDATSPYTDSWPGLEGDPSVIGSCYEEVGGRRLVETFCSSPSVDWRVSHFLPTYDSYCASGSGWTVDGRDYCLARVP